MQGKLDFQLGLLSIGFVVQQGDGESKDMASINNFGGAALAVMIHQRCFIIYWLIVRRELLRMRSVRSVAV